MNGIEERDGRCRLVGRFGVVVLIAACAGGPRLHAQTSEELHARADEALETFLLEYWDGDRPDGTKVDWRFTYNEGLMVGASVEFHEATGNDFYLRNATNILGFVLREEVTHSTFGPVLTDGSNASCGGDCHAFKGIAYRYLMELWRASGDARVRDILEGSSESIWQRARDPETGLFSVSWTGPPMPFASQAQMASAVMALQIRAIESGPYPASGIVVGR